MRRSPRRLSPADFVRGLLAVAANGRGSLGDLQWATGAVCSKVNLWKRMGPQAVALMQAIIKSIANDELSEELARASGKFSRIILEDSSAFGAHPSLASMMPGCGNQSGLNASRKLLFSFDLLSGGVISADLIPARMQDRSMSKRMLECLDEGDLLLRDKGFFTLETFAALNEMGVNFVSRLYEGVALFDLDGKRIDRANRFEDCRWPLRHEMGSAKRPGTMRKPKAAM